MRILLIGDRAFLDPVFNFLRESRRFTKSAIVWSSIEMVLEAPVAEWTDIILVSDDRPKGKNRSQEEIMKLVRKIRSNSKVPLIFLSQESRPGLAAEVLNAGADDCQTINSLGDLNGSLKVLSARIMVISRRHHSIYVNGILSGKPTINFKKRRATLDGKILKLSKIEFKVFTILLQNKGKVVGRNILCWQVWADDSPSRQRGLYFVIHSIRKKMKRVWGDSSCIQTVRYLGYKHKEGS